MAWIAFTSSTVAERLAGAEFTALKNAALGSGQTGATIVDNVIDRVIAEVRGYVANKNTLGAAGTIPDELADAACALFVWRFITRLPSLKALADDARRKNYEDAISLLNKVAAGSFRIVPPETEAEDQAGGHGTELINSRTRLADRTGTTGLL